MDTSSQFIISDAPKSVLTEHWFKDLETKDKEKMEEELRAQDGSSQAVIFCLKTKDKLKLYPFKRSKDEEYSIDWKHRKIVKEGEEF